MLHESHETQKIGDDDLKPLRDLGHARPVANCLFGALVDLADVARGQ